MSAGYSKPTYKSDSKFWLLGIHNRKSCKWALACLVETRTKETGNLLDDGL
jgi:hypothetical protein